jgi:PAS domain S-box-containing protein
MLQNPALAVLQPFVPISLSIRAGGDGRRPGRAKGMAMVGLVAAAAALSVLIGFEVGGTETTLLVDDIGMPLMVATAAAVALVVGTRMRGRAGLGWALIGVSALSWSLGEAAWAVYDLVLHESPFPSFADVGYLMAIPPVLAGIVLLRGRTASPIGSMRVLLDGLLIGLGVLAISWALVLRPVYESSTDGLLANVLGLAYPVGDVLVVTVVLILLFQTGGGQRLTLILLGAGLLANAVADSGFAYLSVTDSYQNGAFTDIVWIAGFTLIGIAALSAKPPLAAAREEHPRLETARTYFPYAVAAAVSAIILYREVTANADAIDFILLGGILLTVVVRQGALIRENVALREVQAMGAYLRTVIDIAPDAVIGFDEAGTITRWNTTADEIFGIDRTEAIGSGMTTLLPGPADGLLPGRYSRSATRANGTEFPADVVIASAPAGYDSTLRLCFVRDVTERRMVLDRLRSTDLARRNLLAKLVTAQEEERRRIAHDIHDDAVQVMTAAKLRLEMLQTRVTDTDQLEMMTTLDGTIALSIARLRNLLFELNPPALERYGLEAAVRMQLQQVSREDGVEIELIDRLDAEPETQLRVILYRIVQEALVNMRKHAHAGHVRVVLETLDGGSRVAVTDNGVGFEPELLDAERPGHLGTAAMRERAEFAGGWLKVHTIPGGGTTVEAWVPQESAVAGAPLEVASV